MSIESVIASIVWSSGVTPWPTSVGTVSAADRMIIETSIRNLYQKSVTAQVTLEAASARGDLKFSIAAHPLGSFAGSYNGFSFINLDLQQIKDLRYFNKKGQVVQEILELAVIHEIIHTEGLIDPDANGPTSDGARNIGNFDFQGDTVRKQNIVAAEMGYTVNDQLSYLSTPSLGTSVANFFVTGTSYSEGKEITVARYGNGGGFGIDFLDASNRSGSGAVLMFGLNSDDILWGGRGDDFLYGGADNDVLKGFEGNDLLDGGTGSDSVWYRTSSASVTVDFAGGATPTLSVTGSDVGKDRLVSIEDVELTQFNDIFRYNGDISAGFALTIDAGAGTDSANFSGAAGSNGLTIDLVAGTLTSKNTGGVIYLTNFESSLIASAYNDDIIDTSTNNKWIDAGEGDNVVSVAAASGRATVYGRRGADDITTGGGADYVIVGDNNLALDRVKTGDGSDLIVSMSAKAQIEAGAGNDYIRTLG